MAYYNTYMTCCESTTELTDIDVHMMCSCGCIKPVGTLHELALNDMKREVDIGRLRFGLERVPLWSCV